MGAELEASVEQMSRAEWAQKSDSIRQDNEPDVTVSHETPEPEEDTEDLMEDIIEDIPEDADDLIDDIPEDSDDITPEE